jgi:probable O-glycosylation ligase (exosortase A-associated)
MLRTLFVLALTIPGLLLAMWSRYWGLLLYLWNAFFRPQDFMWLRTYELRLSLIMGIIFVVPSLLTGYWPNVTHPLSLGMLLFLASGLLAQTNALDQRTGWRWVDAQARLTLVLLIAVNLVRTPRQVMGVIAVAAMSLGFYSTKAGLASLLGGGVQFYDGLDGAFSDNNSYALATDMTIPLLIAIAQNTELTFGAIVPATYIRWIRMGFYLAVLLSINTVIATFSRGGFLGLVAVALAYALFHPRRVRLLLAFAFIGSLAFVVPLPEGYLDRLATLRELQEDTTESPREDVTEGRFYFWGLATDMALEHPAGVGMRNFAAQFAAFDESRGAFGRRRDVHSSHFQVLAEQGLLGAAAWTLEFAYAFYLGWIIRKRSRTPGLSQESKTFLESTSTAFVVSMAGFIVGGSTVSAALNELTWLTFALLASLDYVSRQLCKEAAGRDAREVPTPAAPIRAAAYARPRPFTVPNRVAVGLRNSARPR